MRSLVYISLALATSMLASIACSGSPSSTETATMSEPAIARVTTIVTTIVQQTVEVTVLVEVPVTVTFTPGPSLTPTITLTPTPTSTPSRTATPTRTRTPAPTQSPLTRDHYNGIYGVGIDIAPGRWEVTDPLYLGSQPDCYWARYNVIGNVILDNYGQEPPFTITVFSTDTLVEFDNCGPVQYLGP